MPPDPPIETCGLMFSALATPLNCSTHLHQWYTLPVHCPQRLQLHQSHLVPHWNLHPLPAVHPMHMHDNNKLPPTGVACYCKFVGHTNWVCLSLAPQTHRNMWQQYLNQYFPTGFKICVIPHHLNADFLCTVCQPRQCSVGLWLPANTSIWGFR